MNYPLSENYNRTQVIYNNKIFYFNSMKYDPRTYSYNNFKNPSNKENYSFQNNNVNSNYCFENNKVKINVLIEKQKTKKKKEKKVVVVAGKGYVAAKELRKIKIR